MQPYAKFCTNCGHQLEADDLFCDECGTKIEQVESVIIEETKEIITHGNSFGSVGGVTREEME